MKLTNTVVCLSESSATAPIFTQTAIARFKITAFGCYASTITHALPGDLVLCDAMYKAVDSPLEVASTRAEQEHNSRGIPNTVITNAASKAEQAHQAKHLLGVWVG